MPAPRSGPVGRHPVADRGPERRGRPVGRGRGPADRRRRRHRGHRGDGDGQGGNQRHGRPAKRIDRRIEPERVEADPGHEDDGRNDARRRHHPLGCLPGIGSVLGPAHPPTPEGQAGTAQHRPERQRRETEWARRGGVEEPVGAETQAAHPAEQQGTGRPSGPWGRTPGSAVAARVHGRGQPQRPLEGILHDRDGDAAKGVEAAPRPAPQLAGPAHPLHALDQLRRDAEGRRRRPHRVRRGRRAGPGGPASDWPARSPPRGSTAGCPAAARRRARPCVPSSGDRPTELDARRPGGQRNVGKVEEQACVAGPDVAAEDRTEHHPDGDHGQRQVEVVLEGPGPRGIAAAVGHHHAEDGQHQQEQEGIGGPAGRGGQSQGPDPPGDGVQGPRDPSPAGQAPTVGAGRPWSAGPAAAPGHHPGGPGQHGHRRRSDQKGEGRVRSLGAGRPPGPR